MDLDLETDNNKIKITKTIINQEKKIIIMILVNNQKKKDQHFQN